MPRGGARSGLGRLVVLQISFGDHCETLGRQRIQRQIGIVDHQCHSRLAMRANDQRVRLNDVDFGLQQRCTYLQERLRTIWQFDADQIAGTIVHEIGHSLGIGWEEWHNLYEPETGLFTPDAVGRLGKLAQMEVQRDYGCGTAFSHWDELRFDKELMTGIQDVGEYVLPVTIDLMEVLGHTVNERLEARTPLGDLLQKAASIVFSDESFFKAFES